MELQIQAFVNILVIYHLFDQVFFLSENKTVGCWLGLTELKTLYLCISKVI